MVHNSRTNRSTAVSIVRTPASTAITIPSRTNAPVASIRRSRPRRTRGRALAVPPTSTQPYIRTLNDPFEHPPIRLGWGTMVPTGLGTTFCRGTLTVNTDGSFAIAVEPAINIGGTNANGPILTNTAGQATSTWLRANWSNGVAFNGLANSARPISIGLKVFPQLAATATPGILYVGSIEGAQYGTTVTRTPGSIMASAFMTPGYGQQSAWATGRPSDPNSFIFNTVVVQGTPASSNPTPLSVPTIVGTGFPAGTAVMFEAVFNFEYQYDYAFNFGAASNPMEGGNEANDQSLMSRAYSNIESMWNSVKRFLEPTGAFGALSDYAWGAARNALNRALLPAPNVPRLMAATSAPIPVARTGLPVAPGGSPEPSPSQNAVLPSVASAPSGLDPPSRSAAPARVVRVYRDEVFQDD